MCLCVCLLYVCVRAQAYTQTVWEGGRGGRGASACTCMDARVLQSPSSSICMHARVLKILLLLSPFPFFFPSLTPSLPHNTHTKHTQNTHTHNTRDNSRPSQPLNNTLATRKQHINNTLATPRRVTSIYQRHTHRRQLETNSAPQRSHYTLRPLGQGAGAAGGLLKAKTVDLVDAERDRAMRRRRRRRRRRRGKGFMVCSKQ